MTIIAALAAAVVQTAFPAPGSSAGGAASDSGFLPLRRTPCGWGFLLSERSGEWFRRTIRVYARVCSGDPARVWMRDGLLVELSRDRTCLPTNDTPMHAVKRFLVSFVTQDTVALGKLVTEDFQLSSRDSAFASRFPVGLSRAALLDSVTRLSSVANRGTHGCPVPSLAVFGEFPDTSLDSPPRLAAAARRFVIPMKFAMHEVSYSETHERVRLTPCAFMLVRGDSARVSHASPGNAAHWYVAEWSMGDSALRSLADNAASPGRALSSSTRGLELKLLRNPYFGTQPIEYEVMLPTSTTARLELFDVAGRKLLDHRLSFDVPGSRRLKLERPRLPAGVYWLRVRQAARQATEKLIVLE